MTGALAANAYLHHIHICSPDPAALATFYSTVMNMEVAARADGSFLLSGPRRRVRIGVGEARKLGQAGFAVRDAAALDGLRRHAAGKALEPQDATDGLFQPGAFFVTDPDGNRIMFGLAPDEPEWAPRQHIHGPIQHLTLATRDVAAIEDFYADKLGFSISDRVTSEDGRTRTSFMRSNHEHHTLACFYQDRTGMDHHSYEAGQWNTIRDWADHFAAHDVQLMWGPGRHGPGNNLFIFIKDPDGNWIEVSAELEVIHDRPMKTWPHAERTLNLWGKGLLRS